MSHPRPPLPVKPIISLFSPDRERIGRVLEEFSNDLGQVEWLGPECLFDLTPYYEKEMGSPLYRRFASFERLISPEQIVPIKLFAVEMEDRHRDGKGRRVNIDPGYISPERLILATGKNFSHRVYLAGGIYADLTLIFQKGSFRSLPWTYRDYADPEMISRLNELRKRYLKQLKELKLL